jgi:hypothetical protein
MTAQVAAFNERCVAVASDSTLTIGYGPKARTVQTADKVFDVGNQHRVVVMISGSANFMQVPYDVLIGEWKGQLSGPLATVTEYAESFVNWLSNNSTIFTTDQQDIFVEWLARDIYLAIRRELQNQITESGLAGLPWDNLDVVSLTDSVVSSWVEILNNRELLTGWDETTGRQSLDSRRHLVQRAFDYVFDDVPRTQPSDRVLLEQIPLAALTRAEPWGVDATVAFIGYGSTQTFPAHQVVELTGAVAGRALADWWEPLSVAPDNRAVVTPFAQDEAIQTFLRAYNADFLATAHDHLEAALTGVSGETADEAEELRRQAAHDALTEAFRQLSSERFITPLLDTIEALPRTDMARMAESLVGIQALRAASGDALPTVGGPIDVVVISREHGVEWVRRKKTLND